MNDHERRLARTVEEILESYDEYGNINHLDGSNLPTRIEVAELADELVSIIFPGYFRGDQLDELTSRYFVGERCARILRRLEGVLVRALSVRCDGGELRPMQRRAALESQAHELAFDLLQAVPGIREVIHTDVQAALSGDPAACSSSEVIMSYPGILAITFHRIAHHLYVRRVPLLPRMMAETVHSRTGIDIHPGATIGNSFFIDHGTGVVIGETSLIGERVKLYQGVTLGALSVSKETRCGDRRHPTIANDVTVYAGATILGGDTVIGAGSTIGGNVWITQSIPPGTTVILEAPSQRYVGTRGPNDRDPKGA